MVQPQCEKCGKFIPYSRATLKGALEPPPCVGWVEWWAGVCVKCEDSNNPRPTGATPEQV